MASPFTAFPTFGGPEQGGGITSIKMNPAQVRFPTARRPAPQRRPLEPTDKEKFAPLLPFLVGGITEAFQKEPPKLTDEEYLKNIGANIIENPTTLEEVKSNETAQTKLDAYKLFGDPEGKNTFGMDEIVNILAAGSMGRGAKDYATTYSSIRNAEEKARLTTQTNRTSFLNTKLKDVNNLQMKTFEDSDSARVGVYDARTGFADPRGNVYVMNDTKDGYVNIKELEGNWIEQQNKSTQTLVNQLKDPRLVELYKKDEALVAKDTALVSTVTLTNEVVSMLDKGIANPEQNPLTTITSIGNSINGVMANVDQVLSYVGQGNALDAFATSQDLADGIAGSDGRQGTGDLGRALQEAIISGDDKAIKAAMTAFEEGEAGQEYGINFRESLGDMAYNDVATRRVMLQLAYSAAGTAGQTGRTLSDKDLAFFLQIVGFGATQDPQVAKDNLLGFVDTTIRQTDNAIRTTLPKNRMRRYDVTNDLFNGILGGYWNPQTNADGTFNWTATDEYAFKDFYGRFGDIPDVKIYGKHDRRPGTDILNQTKTAPGTDDSDITALQIELNQ